MGSNEIYIYKKLIHKTETDSKLSKPNLWLPKEKHCGEGWIGSLGLAYTQSIGSKDLLYSLQKSIQYSVTVYMGKEYEKEWLYMYIYG